MNIWIDWWTYHGIVRKFGDAESNAYWFLSRFKDELDDSMKIEDALAMIATSIPKKLLNILSVRKIHYCYYDFSRYK